MPGHDRFRGFLAIPYLDKNGQPLTIRFRCLADHDHRELGHGKYMSQPDDIPRMFNVGAIHRAGDEIHVTEGELDALILTRIGLEAVAIPGAHLWKPRHRIMLSGFNRIWVWGDPDDAGADLVNKITRSLVRARGIRLRDGDVTDTFLAGGADALLSLIPRGDKSK
jgi:DNA primase